jgi:hypothetical protein
MRLVSRPNLIISRFTRPESVKHLLDLGPRLPRAQRESETTNRRALARHRHGASPPAPIAIPGRVGTSTNWFPTSPVRQRRSQGAIRGRRMLSSSDNPTAVAQPSPAEVRGR